MKLFIRQKKSINIKIVNTLTYSNTFNLSLDYICNLTNFNNTSHLKNINKINKKIMTTRLTILEKENNKQAQDIAKELGILKSTYSGYKNPNLQNLMQTLMLKKLP